MVTRLSEYRRLFHKADDLYDLVSDIRRYPDFLPQITAMRIRCDNSRDGQLDMVAEACVRYKFVSERFTTRVKACPAERRIDVEFVSGPFSTLDNAWRFHPLSDGSSLVEFHINAAFRNPVLQMLLDNNKQRAVSSLVTRFSDEAGKRYATSGDAALDLGEEIDAVRQ